MAQSWRYPVAVRLSAQLLANVERLYRALRGGGIARIGFPKIRRG
jgi:hypothetical protein